MLSAAVLPATKTRQQCVPSSSRAVPICLGMESYVWGRVVGFTPSALPAASAAVYQTKTLRGPQRMPPPAHVPPLCDAPWCFTMSVVSISVCSAKQWVALGLLMNAARSLP